MQNVHNNSVTYSLIDKKRYKPRANSKSGCAANSKNSALQIDTLIEYSVLSKKTHSLREEETSRTSKHAVGQYLILKSIFKNKIKRTCKCTHTNQGGIYLCFFFKRRYVC